MFAKLNFNRLWAQDLATELVTDLKQRTDQLCIVHESPPCAPRAEFRGYEYVLVLINHFTRYTQACPMRNKIALTAETKSSMLWVSKENSSRCGWRV